MRRSARRSPGENLLFSECVDVSYEGSVKVIRMSKYENIVNPWEIHLIEISTLRRSALYKAEGITSKPKRMPEY